ncbi:MAG TPA: carbohydrate porin [Rhodopila sp.]|nr:carbohydrate porin [Rhodopila sp.]
MTKDLNAPATGRLAATVLAALGLVLGAHTAAAQNNIAEINNGVGAGQSEALVPPPAPVPTSGDHLFGDWGGLRTELHDIGIDVALDWVSEVAGNVSGGVKQGTTYAGQVALGVDVDWEKLAGVRGFSTHFGLVNREGASDSENFGDNLLAVQEVYGGGGGVLVHMVYSYAEQSLLNGRIDIKLGLMPVLNDFNASPLFCNFMSGTVCGNPKELDGGDAGMSIYPNGVWGTRIRVRPTAQTYIQAGVYQVSQGLGGPDDRAGFDLDGSQNSGVEVPVEVAYEPLIGPQAMPGHYKLGFAYDSSSNAAYFDSAGALLSGIRGTGNKTNYWVAADQMIHRNGPGAADGIILLAGYVHADPALSPYTDQVYVGALDRDFWPSRPLDTIGVLFDYQHVSDQLATEQMLDAEYGLPLANGATGIQTNEAVLEVNYDFHVLPGLSVEPDFQYVIRPNAQSNIGNAAVFGFKSHISF